MKRGLALAGIGILAIIILSAGIIAFLIDPASFFALETQAGQEAYRLTGGLVGTPPPPPPPVKFNVGEEVQWGNLSLGIGWTSQQPIHSSVFQYFGSCKYPTELYALNITNEANVPIVKIVIYHPGGNGVPAPLPAPWYTNSSFYSQAWQGNATSWEIANVDILPHTTYVLWNASLIGQGVPIYFFFSNGSYYETSNYWAPNYPT
jgi:hypothetical protein